MNSPELMQNCEFRFQDGILILDFDCQENATEFWLNRNFYLHTLMFFQVDLFEIHVRGVKAFPRYRISTLTDSQKIVVVPKRTV